MSETTKKHEDQVTDSKVVRPRSADEPKLFRKLGSLLFSKKKKYIIILILLLAAILPTLYFYNRSREAEKRLNDPNTANQQVIDQVVKKVSKHILLPTDEQPTLATISDVEKVKDQAFFKSAQNGDKMLVYTQARKAILYRPSKDIVVEVAPLSVNSSLNQ